MSDLPTISLVVVSRNRRASLRRTISSLRFQSYENFEFIVVSEAADADGYRDLPFAENICHIQFDEPNISTARNIGIAAARGEIVAFCDDDAVPDPLWLERLVAAFEYPNVASAGGYVRGRNGIEFQWRALLCNHLGEDFPLALDEAKAVHIVPYDGVRFAKLQGTNCAFRKSALIDVGGFDEGFRFFLDETDVCLRLAKAGRDSAFVPMAQVHHEFAESDQRSAARVPKSLFDLGASKQRYLVKHAKAEDIDAAKARFADDQRNRLITLMVDGRVEPRDVPRLMATLADGFAADISPEDEQAAQEIDRHFTAFGHPKPIQYQVFGGSTFSRQKLLQAALHEAKNNTPILVMIFSITSLFHRRDYDVRGFWVQTGGVFGKSNRMDPVFRMQSLRDRIKSEFERVQDIFPATELRVVKIFRNFVLEMTKTDNTR